jgi:hypothetical protein
MKAYTNKKHEKKTFKNYFSTNNDDYSKETLEKKTVAEMRTLAKHRQINLKGSRKKDQIIKTLLAYFSQIKTKTPLEVIDNSFDIVSNDLGYINVSVWFKGKGKKLDRCLKSKRFQKLLAEYSKKESNTIIPIQPDEDNAIFLPPVLSVYVASHLSHELHYEILEYYLFSSKSRIIRIPWVKFEATYAYYWFKIGNTLKCGAVGIRDSSNRDNLKTRLSKHRSTYAKFVLLGAIKFKDSQTVTMFENWMKNVLSDYSIDNDDKTLIEQYESTRFNIEETVEKLISTQFSALNAEAKGLGVFCSQDLIDMYNKVSNDRLK